MKITRNKFLTAFLAAESLMKSSNDKLSYSSKRFTDATRKLRNTMSREIGDINLSFASVDEAGNLIKQGENYAYTPANQKALGGAMELYMEAMIDLPKDAVFICEDLSRVETLHHSYEILNGIIFNYDFWAEKEPAAEPA